MPLLMNVSFVAACPLGRTSKVTVFLFHSTSFLPAEYEIGQPVIGSPCSYVINFAQKRTGAIISPTYPGAYPKDMSCTYQFIGKPNQRVRIEFRDFDLFFGGPQ